MNGTTHVMPHLNGTDQMLVNVHFDVDTPFLRKSFLSTGLVIVVLNVLIIICALIKPGDKSEEKFRLLGFSTCNLCSGIVTVLLPMYLSEPTSGDNCRLVHILIPTTCYASVYFLIALFVYSYFGLHGTDEQGDKPEVDDGFMLLVFVFVAWFFSLVCCSLPVVSDGIHIQYSGVCSPDVVFQGSFGPIIVYYVVIFTLPCLIVNAVFLITVLKLRKLMLDLASNVTSVEVLPSSSQTTAADNESVDYSQRKSWENSVIGKWQNILQSKQRQAKRPPFPSTSRRYFNSLARRRDLTRGFGNERTLWKKLQDRVFSKGWRDLQAIESIQSVKSHDSPRTKAPVAEHARQQRRSKPSGARDIPATRERRDYSVYQERLITQFIYLLALDVASIIRILLAIEAVNHEAGLSLGLLLLLSVTFESATATVVSAVRFPHCRNCLKDVYILLCDRFIRKSDYNAHEALPPRDHAFDKAERKRLKSRNVRDHVPSERNAVLKGSLGVRWEKARCNMSKMLPTKRMGISDN